MYHISFYYQPYIYDSECKGDIAVKKGYSYEEAYAKVVEEFEAIIREKLKGSNVADIVNWDGGIRFSFKEFDKKFVQDWVRFIVRELMANHTDYEVDPDVLVPCSYLFENFQNAFYGSEYFEESIPLLNMADIYCDKEELDVFSEYMEDISRGKVYRGGELNLVRCSFNEIEKDLIERNIPDVEIQEYKDSCAEPLDKVILRCPNCGCDRWEGTRTDRVYLGDVDGNVDIVEDPQEDGEVDDTMCCVGCSRQIYRQGY